jgi:NAD(P)H-hydrate epimerase
MNIYSADQIKAWDAFTIKQEPISSVDLMERAARACAEWILQGAFTKKHFHIFCGKGNNGGDGLAIARILLQHDYEVDVYIIEQGAAGTPDFQTNLQRLHKCTQRIQYIQGVESFPKIKETDVVVDAIFGIGLSRPVEGLVADLIKWINNHSSFTIAIDLPTGLFSDQSSIGNTVICANHTLSFQCWKQALLMEENASFVGTAHIVPIGLHPLFEENEKSTMQMMTGDSLKSCLLGRPPFSHKGDYGHALLVAGSKGKMGAAVLAARACMRSGAGLLTAHVPECGYPIMQMAHPEGMVSVDKDAEIFTSIPDNIQSYRAIGMGPGLGTAAATQGACISLLQSYQQPMVLDADALNIIAIRGVQHIRIPENSVLTPHPGEFERLFGSSSNHFERMELAIKQARLLKCVIVLKSRYTLVVSPGGEVWVNPTGNPGMAKAGSGDVLMGIITGLLARGYDSSTAARLGVYLHGYAGDITASQKGLESILAGDIIEQLPYAFSALAG